MSNIINVQIDGGGGRGVGVGGNVTGGVSREGGGVSGRGGIVRGSGRRFSRGVDGEDDEPLFQVSDGEDEPLFLVSEGEESPEDMSPAEMSDDELTPDDMSPAELSDDELTPDDMSPAELSDEESMCPVCVATEEVASGPFTAKRPRYESWFKCSGARVIQAEAVVEEEPRVVNQAVVVSVPKAPVGSRLEIVEAVVEVVEYAVDKVVEDELEEDKERVRTAGEVVGELWRHYWDVVTDVGKEQLTGAYEVLGDVCERVEVEVDVGEVVCELVRDVGDRVEEEERVWLNSVHVDRVCDTWKQGDVVKPVNDEQRAVLKRLREVYAGTEVKHIPSLKNTEKKLVNAELSVVNGLMHNVVTKDDITEIQRLLYAGVYVTVERLGMLKDRKGGKRKVDKAPWWKRRIEESIKKWRKDLGLVDAYKRGNLKNAEERARLERAYGLGAKGYLYVIAFLKGKIHSGTCKIRTYLKRELQYRQNTLFKNDQKQLYKELGGTSQTDAAATAPDAKEATDFWSGIWSNPVEHNRNAEWMERAKRVNARIEKQEDVVIELDDVRRGIRRMTNWKAPGPDAVQGFWFKKFTSMHVRIASGLQGCLAQGWVPTWMTLGRTSLFMKDPTKGTRADNYRPIACLPLMWKLLTGILSEKIYCHLAGNNLLPDEQKGCRKRSRGTKDQLLIDKMILKDAKAGKNLSMAWIDYKKAYDMVPHSWIKEVVDMLGVAGNIGGLLSSSMSGWKTQLMGGTDVLGTVDIKRGIFQGDSLSPLLFVMIMIPLSQQLNAANKGYKLKNTDRSISHLLFMDDLKLYARKKSELEELVGVVKDYSDDIRMEFGMSKCAVLSVVGGKRVEEVGLELPSGEVMADVEEEGYKYLGVLQTETFMYKEMKKKVLKEYFKRLKLLLKSELYAGNLIAGINAWAIGIVRYTAGVLDWTKGELSKVDVETRKMLTMHGAFHRKSNVDRLYLKRKDGGRGLISVFDCVKLEEENLLKYVTDSDEWMLQKVLEHGIVRGDAQADYKKATELKRKESLLAKPLHGRFFRTTKEDSNGEVIAGPRSWEWVRSGYMTKSTEAYLFAAQEQALGTRAVRSKIYREEDEEGGVISAMCRIIEGDELPLRGSKQGAERPGGCWNTLKNHIVLGEKGATRRN